MMMCDTNMSENIRSPKEGVLTLPLENGSVLRIELRRSMFHEITKRMYCFKRDRLGDGRLVRVDWDWSVNITFYIRNCLLKHFLPEEKIKAGALEYTRLQIHSNLFVYVSMGAVQPSVDRYWICGDQTQHAENGNCALIMFSTY